VRTEESQRLTLLQGGDGEGENGVASTIFGPVRAGLTTTQTTPPQLHTESLNDLVRLVDDLVSKYLEVSDTLITATERLVKRGRSGFESSTTEEEMC
jgi:hypothetical protein